MSESSYSRDPRVPPVHVEHLGKHRNMPTAGEAAPVRPAMDRGPSYDDFLEHDVAVDEAADDPLTGEAG